MNKPNFYRAIALLLFTVTPVMVAAADKKAGHPVKVYELQDTALAREYRLLGSVEAKTQISVLNRESGQILELPWFEGDRVSQGDLLLRIDDREISAELDKAEANLKQARIDLNRLEKLQPRNLASEDEVARAATQLELARAEESLLRTRLSDTRIQSPVNGIISSIKLRSGSYAPENTHILSLFDPETLFIQAYLPEVMVAGAENASWTVRFPSTGNAPAQEARLQRIYPFYDPATRQTTIELAVTDNSRLLPGMQADILMEAAPRSRLWLPLMAVQEDESGRYVFINKDGKATRRDIETGEIRADHIEVTDGIEAGTQVVITGFNGLSEGRKLQIEN